jgi:hypothetical protein
MMVNARLGRLATLAVGLGVGAAMASSIGTASADTVSDPYYYLGGIDPLSAATASPIDLDISVDGFQLLDLGTGATATSGMGDIAIAFGANSYATAEGGFGDYALATDGAHATAGNTILGATGSNFDFASAEGIGTRALAGDNSPFTAGNQDSFDYASASSGTNAPLGEGALALAGLGGSGDSATAVGQGAIANAGLGLSTGVTANYDSAFSLGNLTAPTVDNIRADAIFGSNDNAFVIDPSGTLGSSAISGDSGNFDLAGVFGDGLHAVATGGSNMVDILPAL